MIVLDYPCKWDFVFTAITFILCIDDSFVHSSVRVHLGYLYVSAAVNAAQRMLVRSVVSGYFYLAKPKQSP